MFLVGPFCEPLCSSWRCCLFLTPATNAVYPQRIWLFLLGLAPFLLLVLRVFAFGRNANLAGGFAGRRGLVVVFFCFDSAFGGLLQVHGHSAMYLFRFYHFYFCQDRASGDIGHTGGKKKVLHQASGASGSAGRARAFMHIFFFLEFGRKCTVARSERDISGVKRGT